MTIRARQWALYLVYRGLAAVLRLIPPRIAAALATFAGLTISALWREKRPLVRANLRRVLGPDADEAVVDGLVTGAFVSYARYWVESARVGALRSDQIESTFSIDGFERLRVEMARGSGVVVVLPHVGSWEYGGRWLAQQGYPMTTVGELLEPPELFEWFTSQREALGLTVLPPGPGTTVRLLDTLREGRVVGLLADRDLAGNGVEVEFFGERTTLPAGPALLALRSGAPLMPCAIYQRRHGLYHAVLQPPLDSTRSGRMRQDVHRLTQDMAHALEELIRLAPEQWHLFQPNWPSDRERYG
ncbi:MAG: phosphatidylinositol mannoside acyltransferase [Acidimicrobiales bacterium]